MPVKPNTTLDKVPVGDFFIGGCGCELTVSHYSDGGNFIWCKWHELCRTHRKELANNDLIPLGTTQKVFYDPIVATING